LRIIIRKTNQWSKIYKNTLKNRDRILSKDHRLFSEFEAALGELINGKAIGKDGIPAELLKALGAKGKRQLCDTCN